MNSGDRAGEYRTGHESEGGLVDVVLILISGNKSSQDMVFASPHFQSRPNLYRTFQTLPVIYSTGSSGRSKYSTGICRPGLTLHHRNDLHQHLAAPVFLWKGPPLVLRRCAAMEGVVPGKSS